MGIKSIFLLAAENKLFLKSYIFSIMKKSLLAFNKLAL